MEQAMHMHIVQLPTGLRCYTVLGAHLSHATCPCLLGFAPVPPASPVQIAQTQAMLANEYGTASNIKSRVNRQSVLAAITSAQQRLKLYTKVGTPFLNPWILPLA